MPASPLIYVLNGPNLNLLGMREPEIYGTDTLDDIATRVEDRAKALGARVEIRQSNHEGHLIDWLHEASAVGAKAVLLNAAGFTHTSIAILDAIKAIKVPVFEVHLSDPHKREEFRHLSYVGMAAKAVFAENKENSYELALDAALQL
jgi:3-dehydroquinate dehydratase-2